MKWENIRSIPKFTVLSEAFLQYGQPRFKLGDKPVFYLGNGWLISYSEIKFLVEDSKRIEYGDKGEYALGLYYFIYKNELECYFKLKHGEFDFESECIGEEFQIFDDINLGDTFNKVKKVLRQVPTKRYYNEGETRAFSIDNGKFIFEKNWIAWNNLELFFFGKYQKTKLTAFRYTFLSET